MTLAERLATLRALLAAGWYPVSTRAAGACGTSLTRDSAGATRFGLMAAWTRVHPEPDWASPAWQGWHGVHKDAARALGAQISHRDVHASHGAATSAATWEEVCDWHDEPHRTQDQVLAAIDRAIAALER